MHNKSPVDLQELFQEVLGEKSKTLIYHHQVLVL